MQLTNGGDMKPVKERISTRWSKVFCHDRGKVIKQEESHL